MKKYIAGLLTLLVIGVFVLTFFIYKLVTTISEQRAQNTSDGSYVSETVNEGLEESGGNVTDEDMAPPPRYKEDLDDSETMIMDAPTAEVSGKLCYPSEMIPPLEVFLKSDDLKYSKKLETAKNQSSYKFTEVPAGKYVVYAWVKNGELGGSYSKAVPCGLNVSCTDHSPITLDVSEGEVVKSADVCDWYGSKGDVPERF